MPRIAIFHNISRDASFGLNSVFRTGETAPEGASAIKLSDGRWTWKDYADTPDERHELVWVFQYEAEWTGDRADPYALLNDAFERFNGGSGREDARYFGRKLRSLSVGDVVLIDGDAYSCDSVGWSPVHRDDLRFLCAAQAEQVIRERYEIGPREELAVTVPLAD